MIDISMYNQEFVKEDFEDFLANNKAFSGIRVAFDEIDKAISDYETIVNLPGEKSTKSEVVFEAALLVLEDLKVSIFNEMKRRSAFAKKFTEDLNDSNNR